MAKKIVVLDDGETWAGGGIVMTITDDAYEKLCDGEDVKFLTDVEILERQTIDTEN